MSEIKTIEQAADEYIEAGNTFCDSRATAYQGFIAGAKHQKELSDAREKLLLDVISEMKNGLKKLESKFHSLANVEFDKDFTDAYIDCEILSSSVAKKLEGL